ncbi:MAG TPA: FadR/GntR family transcriptional regulator [Acidimicrobiales bacterium]|nr:FadR/GntR family transcriptional regulator [Acidimicrobiales bacterium]
MVSEVAAQQPGALQLGAVLERQGRLSEQLADHIEQAISGGSLEVGASIPSERVLAEQFGVSRTVVREAVRSLVARGLLDVRAGAGTVVTIPTAPEVARAMTLLLSAGSPRLGWEKVSEVRRIVEVEIAGIAATRHDPENLAELAAAVEAIGAEDVGRADFVHFDVEFHRVLARATGNELLVIIEESIGQVLTQVRQAAYEVPGAIRSAHHHHARLLAAVRRRDASGARLAMRRHLDASDRILRRVPEPPSRFNGR